MADDLLRPEPFVGKTCTVAQALDLLDDDDLRDAVDDLRVPAVNVATFVNREVPGATLSAYTVLRHRKRHEASRASTCRCP